QQHGGAILVGRVEGDGGVHCARTAADEARSGYTREFSGSFDHVCGSRFVARDHHSGSAALRGIVYRIENGEKAFSWHAGHELDAVEQQRLEKQLSACLTHKYQLSADWTTQAA